MENDGVIIYQVVDFVKELCDSLTDLSRSEDYNFLPFHVEKIDVGERFNWMLEDAVKTQVSASVGTVSKSLNVRRRKKSCRDKDKSC